MTLALGWTILVFLVGLAYKQGELRREVSDIQEWRREIGADVKAIRSTTDRIDAVLRHEAQR